MAPVASDGAGFQRVPASPRKDVTGTAMFVVKRDGRQEFVQYDKITSRIEKLCYGMDRNFIDPPLITKRVVDGLYSGVSTVELDNLAAETAAALTVRHPDYATLAARIAVANLHKETKYSFSGNLTTTRAFATVRQS